LKNIDYLELSDNHFDKDGAKLLASSEFPKLKYLYIHQNPIGNPGMSYLTKARWPA
jgi:hypothetical protein